MILIHATSVVLGAAARPFGGPEDQAVLLLGRSGSGKSDVALRLIALGARLVSDDQTVLDVEAGRLFAAAPAPIAGLIELRGVGVIRLDAAGRAPVVLAVSLQPDALVARLPAPERFFHAGLPPFDAPPIVTLEPFAASTPAKIAAAASAAARGGFVAGVAPSE